MSDVPEFLQQLPPDRDCPECGGVGEIERDLPRGDILVVPCSCTWTPAFKAMVATQWTPPMFREE